MNRGGDNGRSPKPRTEIVDEFGDGIAMGSGMAIEQIALSPSER